MLTLLLAGALAAPVPDDALAAPPPPPVKAFLARRDLQAAIHAALAEAPPREQHAVYRNRALERFNVAFEEARVPDCLHQDGLKHQPTGFLLGGFMYVGVSGVPALPFVAIAKLRGKCN